MASTLTSSAPTPQRTARRKTANTLANTAMAYQAQDASITLREGLAEYFRESPGLMEEAELPQDLGIGLHSHDIAHVVFGCDTSFLGEVVLVR